MPRVNGAVETEVSDLNKFEVAAVKPDSKFTFNLQSDGKMSVTFRTDSEAELDELIERWEPRILIIKEPPDNSKTRYYAGENCPSCNNKLVRRQGRNGKFLSCSGYPDCHFSQSL